MEWAIEHVKTYGKPVAATICVGPNGDEDGVSLGKDYSIMDYLTMYQCFKITLSEGAVYPLNKVAPPVIRADSIWCATWFQWIHEALVRN